MVGTGYVGLISGLCFAEFGFNVTCVDRDEERLEKLRQNKMPIYEPGLEELFNKHYINTKRIKLSNDLKSILSAKYVMIALAPALLKDINDSKIDF